LIKTEVEPSYRASLLAPDTPEPLAQREFLAATRITLPPVEVILPDTARTVSTSSGTWVSQKRSSLLKTGTIR
jgi:hypothetical protein